MTSIRIIEVKLCDSPNCPFTGLFDDDSTNNIIHTDKTTKDLPTSACGDLDDDEDGGYDDDKDDEDDDDEDEVVEDDEDEVVGDEDVDKNIKTDVINTKAIINTKVSTDTEDDFSEIIILDAVPYEYNWEVVAHIWMCIEYLIDFVFIVLMAYTLYYSLT